MSDRICILSKGQQQVHVSSGMALILSLKGQSCLTRSAFIPGCKILNIMTLQRKIFLDLHPSKTINQFFPLKIFLIRIYYSLGVKIIELGASILTFPLDLNPEL
jgi:hypothetical protein